jgi:hypothetical protein
MKSQDFILRKSPAQKDKSHMFRYRPKFLQTFRMKPQARSSVTQVVRQQVSNQRFALDL